MEGVRTQKSELRPKVHGPKEGEVDGDAINEGANDAWGTNVLGDGILSKLRAGSDG
jgi:hypothetical protein